MAVTQAPMTMLVSVSAWVTNGSALVFRAWIRELGRE